MTRNAPNQPENRQTSKTQAELMAALLRGARVHFMPYMGRFNQRAYYWRNDSHKKCTAATEALLARGLAEKYDETWRDHKVRAKQPTP